MSSPASLAKLSLIGILGALVGLQVADAVTTFAGLNMGLSEGNALFGLIIVSSWGSAWILLKALYVGVMATAALLFYRAQVVRPLVWAAAGAALVPALLYSSYALAYESLPRT